MILLFHCHNNLNLAEILIAPQTQHLLMGVDQTATFFCQAVGINAFWSINGETLPAHGNANWTRKGWTFHEIVDEDFFGERDNIHNMTLQIPSNIEFNNTQIVCIGVVHDPAFSDPAFLIIKGTYGCICVILPSADCLSRGQ